eukprot:992826-Amphidinium_carterae.1
MSSTHPQRLITCKHSSGRTWKSTCIHRPRSACRLVVTLSMGVPRRDSTANPPLPRPRSLSLRAGTNSPSYPSCLALMEAPRMDPSKNQVSCTRIMS